MNPAFRKSLDDFWLSAQGADVILYHPKALASPDIAQKLGIPCVSMPPVPVTYPVSEFPNMAIAPTKNLGPTLNRLSYAAVSKPDIASMGEINDFRESALRLPPRRAGELTYAIDGQPIPILCPVSPALFPEVTSWNGRVNLTGFLFLDEAGQALPPEIERFLHEGGAPIVVSFSSMPLKRPEAFRQMLVDALRQTGDCAIVLTGKTGMVFAGNRHILAVPDAPHGLLFPRAKGVLHHGGVGTMAAALAAGVPQCVMPFSADQPFWANRLHKLGIAPAPLGEKSLTADRLSAAFRAMGSDAAVAAARQMGARIRGEDGVGRAAAFIMEQAQLGDGENC